jgi:Rrf2 family protein
MSANSKLSIAIHILTLLHVKRPEAMSSAFIAGSVNTNPVVIRRLLADLVEAGLVSTQKGVNGGYQLTRSADSITLADVYLALKETSIFGLHTAKPNPLCSVGKTIETKLSSVYDQIDNTLLSALSGKKIADFTP